MELNTNYLASALRGEAAAKAQLNAQQANMEQAQQLVNTAAPTNQNRTIFDALNANMDRQRGREMQSATEPRLKQARESAAQTYGAGQIYSEGVRQENQGYNREQSRLTQAREKRIREQNLTREDEQLATKQSREDSQNAAARTEMRGEPTLFRNDTTGDELNVIMTDNGPVDSQGNRVNLAGFREVEEDSGIPSRLSVFTGLNSAQKTRAETYLNNTKKIDNMAGIAQSMTEPEQRSFNDLATRVSREIGKGVTPERLRQIVTDSFDLTPKQKDFMTRVYSLTQEERNRLFGSALTKTEKEISEAYMPGAGGLTLPIMMMRMGVIHDNSMTGLETIGQLTGSDVMSLAPAENVQSYRAMTEEKMNAKAGEDSEAVEWAKQNPNDPRAKQIMELNQ